MVSQFEGFPLKVVKHIARNLNLLRIRCLREFRNLKELSLGGTLLEGLPLAGGDRVALLFIGTDHVLRDIRLWFKEEPRATAIPSDEIHAMITNQDIDGVIVENSFFADHKYREVLSPYDASRFQSLVDLEIHWDKGFEALLTDKLGKRKRKNIRRMMKMPFTFRVSTSPKDLSYLYEEILVPSTKDQHGERSHLPSLRDFSQGMVSPLMHICESFGQPQVVNFMLLEHEAGRARLWRQGLAAEVRSDRKLRSEATIFCDAHTIEYCLNEGFQVVSFGKSACLEADGGYWNKASWGCNPQIDNYYPFCYLYSLTPTMMTVCTEMGFVDEQAINDKAAADGPVVGAAVEKNAALGADKLTKAS